MMARIYGYHPVMCATYVTDCAECGHCSDYKEGEKIGRCCDEMATEEGMCRHIPNKTGIPRWCPLPTEAKKKDGTIMLERIIRRLSALEAKREEE